jgi:tRNA(fMet)-specific endonuclease VapC
VAAGDDTVILLDTNTCINIINAKPAAVLRRFRDYRMGEIGLCSVVAAELAYGVSKSGSTRNREALDLFLAPLAILPFDQTALWCCGDLRADLERQGAPIGALDTLIAAHALSLQATLVTNNIKEFERVPGLQLDNWVPSS